MYGYKGERPPEFFNMARYCLEIGDTRPADKCGLIVIKDATDTGNAESWAFGELEDAVLKIASGLLADGHAPGDRIVIRLENTSDYALLFFGAIAAGLTPLPASSVLSGKEVSYFLADCDARSIALSDDLPAGDISDDVRIYSPHDISQMRKTSARGEFAATRADDPAFLVYTSGTTARPKGVLQAQRSVWGRRPMYRGWYGISASDRVLHAGAFNWTYTLGTGLSDPWANGATALVYTGEKDPSIWLKLMTAHEATIFAAVPTVFRQILKYCDVENDFPKTLRHGLTAGETLPEDVAQEWQERTGTVLYEALGMSEMSTYISSSPAVPPRPGAIGKAQEGREVVILSAESGADPLPPGQEGLIAIHSTDPGLMLGYWNRPDEEADVMRGDWFCGGDLGIMDEDGYITHLGRNDDLMNAFGFRVSPLEIEQILGEHQDVSEAAVAEVKVRDNISIIAAFIVLREGAEPNVGSLQKLAENRLAAYKVPKTFIFKDSLPHTPNGKVKRSELRRTYKSG